MGNLGWSEMFFIVVFALIVFGPRKLPEIARTLGKTMAQLRRMSDEFKQTWETELEREALKEEEKAAESNPLTEASSLQLSTDTTDHNSYENLIPEPEATQPSQLLGNADSSSANSGLKTDSNHPVSIA